MVEMYEAVSSSEIQHKNGSSKQNMNYVRVLLNI